MTFNKRVVTLFALIFGVVNSQDRFNISMYSNDEKDCFEQRQVSIKDSCHKLFSQGPCESTEWVVIQKPAAEDDHRELLKAVCKPNLCPQNEDWWTESGQCWARTMAKTAFCGLKQEVITDMHGDGKCICPVSHGELAGSNDCYEYYSRGPCADGEVFTYDAASAFAVCTVDRCLDQNAQEKSQIFAPMNGEGHCSRLGSPEGCKFTGFVFNVHKETNLPRCVMPRRARRNLADAVNKCMPDDNNECRDAIVVSRPTTEQYMNRLKMQLRRMQARKIRFC